VGLRDKSRDWKTCHGSSTHYMEMLSRGEAAVLNAYGLDDPDEVAEEIEKLMRCKLKTPFLVFRCPTLQTDDVLKQEVGLSLPAYGAVKQW
jgi:hypothetical protein